jgi:hypothetical protein
MNTDIYDKIELERLETGDVLDDEDVFYATALKTVTLPNENGGFTNHPKGDRVRIDREEAIRRFGENQVKDLAEKFEKHKQKIALKEVIAGKDGRFYAQ